jgi:uroporphyrinogen decarboxylase
MRPIDRMRTILAGRMPDRRPFVPSVYEHGAALLGRGPTEVSRDAGLMAEAALAGYRAYAHDLVTVGIDIYNVEAEAFGCRLSRHGAEPGIPGVLSHPLAGPEPPQAARLPIPEAGPENRLGLVAEACRRVAGAVGDEVWVYACTGGPFSQAVELRGYEDFMMDVAERPAAAHALLARTAELSRRHADRLSRLGVGVYLYESWATVPLIGPPHFAEFVVPYARRVIRHVRAHFDTPPPAVVMGGDISLLIDFLLEAESGLVACDTKADFDLVRSRCAGRPVILRGCVDPKRLEAADWDHLGDAVRTMAEKARGMPNFVWGCGCVSYHTPPETVLRFKELCLAAEAEGA